jgi:hypothetical protein
MILTLSTQAMDKSGQEHQGEMTPKEYEQEQDLDAVFSTFFEKVEQLKPVSKPRSAKDYLQSNRDKIIHALSKGYTYSDLAQMLQQCGFSISASTLRRYIGPVKGRKGDPIEPSARTSSGIDSVGLSDEPNSEGTKMEQYQPPLKPRRK